MRHRGTPWVPLFSRNLVRVPFRVLTHRTSTKYQRKGNKGVKLVEEFPWIIGSMVSLNGLARAPVKVGSARDSGSTFCDRRPISQLGVLSIIGLTPKEILGQPIVCEYRAARTVGKHGQGRIMAKSYLWTACLGGSSSSLTFQIREDM